MKGLSKPSAGFTLALICAYLQLLSSLSFACGPFFPEALFSHKLHPDFPLENFAGGELGVIQPTYARSYLFVAYRYLSGIGLDTDEQRAVVSLWKDRLAGSWQDRGPWVKDWMAARSKVGGIGLSPEIRDTFRDSGKRYWYANCLEDTFRSARITLDNRIRQFGPNSAEIREWVKGQDQVLSNCSDKRVIPSSLPSSMNPLLRADRAYQIAAAHFYAGDFDVAEKMFREISNDPSSPWSVIAPYLATRALVRQATLNAEPDAVDVKLLLQVESELGKVLQDSRFRETHPAARRLMAVVRLRSRPLQRLGELADAILQNNSGNSLKQDLGDYTWLLDRYPQQENPDDLTDWIMTFQHNSQLAVGHSLDRWRQTKSFYWLVALITKINAKHANSNEVLKAAAMVDQKSPGYLTVTYHRVRILLEAGRKTEAQMILDELLSGQQMKMPPSAQNQFKSQRLSLARNMDEFLKYAPRIPSMISATEDERELPDPGAKKLVDSYFDVDAVQALNRAFSLELLKDMALKDSLPLHLRRELASATWVRAVLLNDEKIALTLAPVLTRLVPELSGDLQDYVNASTAGARHFAGFFTILKHPGMRPYVGVGLSRLTPLRQIDDFRDNWWCSPITVFLAGAPGSMVNFHQGDKAANKAAAEFASPDFLDNRAKTVASKELLQLNEIDTAPVYLSKQVIEWAKNNPGDPRAPEALHLAVRSTRYGCADEATSEFSRTAFRLLHQRYPKNEWTKKTPFWFQ